MKSKVLIISIFVCLFVSSSQASDRYLWFTFSNDIIQVNPGVEADFIIHKNFGIQLGVASFIRLVPEERLANLKIQRKVGFSNFNIGPSYTINLNEEHKLGFTVGFKMYHSPHYKRLAYFDEKKHFIYFDATHMNHPDFGIDLGLKYSQNRFSALLKYDTARQWLKVGLGMRFGN